MSSLATSTYPPSPPAEVAFASGHNVDDEDDDADEFALVAAENIVSPFVSRNVNTADPAKPLTIANLATLPGSFSTISTTPTSDLEDGSSSEVSFSSLASSGVTSAASSASLSDISPPTSPATSTNNKEHDARTLSKLFGSTYATQFTSHGVTAASASLTGASKRTRAVILESSAHDTRTLYVVPSNKDIHKLDTARLVELLELADESFDCDGLVIALEKKHELLEDTLHSLLYAGGAVVHPTDGQITFDNTKYVLVGLEI